MRPRLMRWGASDAEVAEPYPGADLVPEGKRAATMAVTIGAPPEQVWPWLVQMGVWIMQARMLVVLKQNIERVTNAPAHTIDLGEDLLVATQTRPPTLTDEVSTSSHRGGSR